jgi:spermidine/putrescine transport system substrate-binding protein
MKHAVRGLKAALGAMRRAMNGATCRSVFQDGSPKAPIAGRPRRILFGALLMLALLAACGGAPPALPPVVEAYGRAVPRDSLAATLYVFNYTDYLAPELMSRFEREYGVRVVVDFYDHTDAMIAKLLAGGIGQYDVVIAADYAVAVLRARDLLLPLDHARLPLLANLDSTFRDPPFDPGNQYSVGYQWGTSGLGIRTDRVSAGRPFDTWRLVFDSATAVGPFTMLDEPREVIGAALKYLGFSANTTDSGELARAEVLLRDQHRRVLAYASATGSRDLLAAGDAVVAHAYSGDVVTARAEVPAIRYVLPREGALLWTDNLVIPVGARNRYTAEVFVNFLLDARNGAALSNYTRFATPNRAALPLVDSALTADPAIYPPPDVRARLEILRDLGADARLYDAVWTRVMAGR